MDKKNKNDNLIMYKAGKSGNPNGRPRNMLSSILVTLLDEGELVTRSLVRQTYQVLLSLNRTTLLEIAKDPSQPILTCAVARKMLSEKSFETIEIMLDRANGKSTQMQKIKNKTKITAEIKIELPEPDEETKKRWENSQIKPE